jgi:hypothetical protein
VSLVQVSALWEPSAAVSQIHFNTTHSTARHYNPCRVLADSRSRLQPSLSLALKFWHRNFTFNSNKTPTWCNNFSVYYTDLSLQLNMFRAFFRPSSGAQRLQWQPLVLPSYRGDSRAVFVVGPAGRPSFIVTSALTVTILVYLQSITGFVFIMEMQCFVWQLIELLLLLLLLISSSLSQY